MDWSFRNDLPIYTQLMGQITEAIVSGKLLPGEKMQSVREIAAEAGVNPNTVQRALTDLEREGLVFTQRTSGRFITEDNNLIEDKRKEMAEYMIKEFVSSMEKIGFSKKRIIELLEEMAK